jgi:hypothetical protein
MSATSVVRFTIFGAVGFGGGAALAGALLGLVGLPLTGSVGGAALGFALKDWRRTVNLALLGALGMTVGAIAGLVVGSFFSYASMGPIAATVGAVVGASLGAALSDWRTILALAVAGAVGFYVGSLPADFVRFYVPVLRQLGESGSYVVVGLVGGASLGAALGYLESRKLASERTPGVV